LVLLLHASDKLLYRIDVTCSREPEHCTTCGNKQYLAGGGNADIAINLPKAITEYLLILQRTIFM
jgi:hypothetical protein